MSITVEAIFYAPKASKGMESLQVGKLIQGVGLEGDRYAQRVGSYSVFRKSQHFENEQEPGRQLTLLSADGVEEALRNAKIDPQLLPSIGNLRRNIILRGISSGELLSAIGKVIQLGDESQVLVHRNCVPCMYNEKKNQIPGMVEALWESGGVSCEVIQGGDVSVGSTVSIIDNIEKRMILDPGNQAPGFFTRPSMRTAEMVKTSLVQKKEDYQTLLQVDPEGVKRLEASYESVGLSFWPKSCTG